MANITSEKGLSYLLTKAVSAVISTATAVGFLMSAEYDSRLAVPALLIFIAFMDKDMLNEKHQKIVCRLTSVAAVMAALMVTASVGLWIFNARYLAAVMFTSLAVMAFAEAVFFASENMRNRKNV
ncbi:hypothetical protein [Ruminococcus albus]|uniref:Uncharacterized protein n=1 Tax=Ruminococcus albus (strain ATCC 27210 / DSM 20455 / JCM 14654 / NCDO 2250 / 7) TaxID=697329 RepID=E6UIQ5_RUMA7|nr:hypothetical protein [Ruminococcus albus]ADU21357.1 hypothetical protein Rumal_0828 [Ruminococcus albus 7 = DSM 20455]